MNKETQIIMKGYAILFIVLHNFCHLDVFGLPQENEMSFTFSKWIIFLDYINSNIFFLIPSILSFIGWSGVSLFVFISGYGLSKKYSSSTLVVVKYIKHSYVKLLIMILPAAILYFSYYLFDGNLWWISRNIFSLTFLSNLLTGYGGSFASSIAPPYWYIGMTFQLYLWFIFVHKYSNRYILYGAILFMLPLLIIPSLANHSMLLGWLKRNSFGWMPLFLLGCYIGRKHTCFLYSTKMNIGLMIISILFVLWSNSNYYLWCFLPIGAVLFFLTLSLLTVRNRIATYIMMLIGNKSMYLFLACPIAISLTCSLSLSINAFANIYYWLLIYIVILIIIAEIYSYFYKKILNKYLQF